MIGGLLSSIQRPGAFGRAAAGVALACLCLVLPAFAQAPAPASADYEWREADIAMRDGVKLHTILLVPHGARRAPILLNRTPFGAEHRIRRKADRLADAAPAGFRELADGYIIAVQDVRGRGGSGGDYVVARPLSGPFNPTGVDPSTDAWDTIDWLVKHTPESNGRVGVVGSSYEGFTALMALIRPHPALKAAAPIAPMVDGWKGDDWFHNGAFRQTTMTFAFYFGGPGEAGVEWPSTEADDYAALLAWGSAGAAGAKAGLDRSSFWRTLTAHPAYDAYWQDQALDRRLAAQALQVPILHVASLWDQEDIYGAPHAYAAAETRDRANDRNFLVIGPWTHNGWRTEGLRIGPLDFGQDTSAWFRTHVLKPFLDEHLTDAAPRAGLAPVTAFETGTNAWRTYRQWPVSCRRGCTASSRPLYLHAGGAASFSPPTKDEAPTDRYRSDPADPVPFSARPVRIAGEVSDNWEGWLAEDQRTVSARPDVLTWVSAPLDRPLRISGEPMVNLVAATTGADADWVVKLIDVWPDDGGPQSGYQLAVGMDIFRARYRQDPARPSPVTAGAAETYRFALPLANHVFRPGHRIMVQVQSSWSPLYDRNPQTFVRNIFLASPGDFRAATQTVFHSPGRASLIELPVAAH
jgi:putative CocE/NonD family hydrolase